MSAEDVATLTAEVRRRLPEKLAAWPGGWPEQIEAALIDAVLSIRARYGSANTGVRGSVRRYREATGEPRPDSLTRLSLYDPEELAGVLQNRQLTHGTPKAAAIVLAAKRLRDAGAETAADVKAENTGLEQAYASVPGLGWVTWEYFTMLLGRPGVKADVWITRFVSEALGRDVTAREAHTLVHAVADQEHLNPSQLDHAIWTHLRRG